MGRRFTTDTMLGKLARWLRLSGYDTYYSRKAGDSFLLEKSKSEGRVLLTRDRDLVEKARKLSVKAVLIRSTSIEAQLAQMLSLGLRLKAEPSQALCPLCGSEVRVAGEEEVASLPRKVKEKQEEFYMCEECGKIYWEGSHWENIRKRLERVENNLQDTRRGEGAGESEGGS